MSRMGAKPLPVPKGVKVSLKENIVNVEGSKGKISWPLPQGIKAAVKQEAITLSRSGDDRGQKSLHGLSRGIIKNMIAGVTEGHNKSLEVVGVGYRWKMDGKVLNIQLGYSHPINYQPPPGIEIMVKDNTNLTVNGVDKQLVGQVAAEIRCFRLPEPYKGKGIRYQGERIWRKAGKTGAKA